MRNDQHLAIKLRKKKKSYNEISKLLGIPKSTLHYWFRDLKWSKSIKRELTEKAQRLSKKRMKAMASANKKRWQEWRKQHRQEAKKEFPFLKSNPLFVAGLMLYWGEGDSSLKRQVKLANTDPRMIVVFKKFLLDVCKIPKENIFVILTIYPDLSEKKCKKFWSTKTKIPLNQFAKSQVIYGRHPTRRLENGICTIRAAKSVSLKEKIMVWIDLSSKEFNCPKRKRG